MRYFIGEPFLSSAGLANPQILRRNRKCKASGSLSEWVAVPRPGDFCHEHGGALTAWCFLSTVIRLTSSSTVIGF